MVSYLCCLSGEPAKAIPSTVKAACCCSVKFKPQADATKNKPAHVDVSVKRLIRKSFINLPSPFSGIFSVDANIILLRHFKDVVGIFKTPC